METGSGTYIAIIRGMLTAKPTMNRTNLSCRSRSRASFSASSLTSPEIPRYWYPAASIASFISPMPESEGL